MELSLAPILEVLPSDPTELLVLVQRLPELSACLRLQR
jgi:hypothetical protein